MEFRISSNCLKVIRGSVVNGSLKPNTTQMAILNDIRLDSLPRVLLKRMVLTTMRPFSLV